MRTSRIVQPRGTQVNVEHTNQRVRTREFPQRPCDGWALARALRGSLAGKSLHVRRLLPLPPID